MATKTQVRMVNIGENKGEWRWFGQGKWLHIAGFAVGKRLRVIFNDGEVIFTVHPQGTRKVSGKGDTPVIDINSSELRKLGTKDCAIIVTRGKLRIVPRSEVK